MGRILDEEDFLPKQMQSVPKRYLLTFLFVFLHKIIHFVCLVCYFVVVKNKNVKV